MRNVSKPAKVLCAVVIGVILALLLAFPPHGGQFRDWAFHYAPWGQQGYKINRDALWIEIGIASVIAWGLYASLALQGNKNNRWFSLPLLWLYILVTVAMLTLPPWEFISSQAAMAYGPSAHTNSLLRVWRYGPFFGRSSLPLCPDCPFEAINWGRLAFQLSILALAANWSLFRGKRPRKKRDIKFSLE